MKHPLYYGKLNALSSALLSISSSIFAADTNTTPPSAEPAVQTLPTLSFQASAEPQKQKDDDISAVPKTVITRDEMLQYGDQSVMDALRRAAGFQLPTPGQGPRGGGGASGMRFRGGAGPTFLINGEPVQGGPRGGMSIIDTITPEMIERIEIVKQPSVAQASVASSAVINIILKEPLDNRISGSVKVGYGLRSSQQQESENKQINIQADGRDNAWSYSVSANQMWVDNTSLTKTETATRVRGRIETVINWAKARDLFVGDNPACWEGGLKSILPNPSKVQKVVNHLSMPYQDIPALMKTLYRLNYPSANALKMTIFTACRTSEVLNIQLKEIKDGVWTIPAERMKAGVEHKVPLPTQLMAIIQDSKNLGDGSDSYLFTSLQKQSTLSNAAMTYLLKRLNLADVATVHGFRASFRMWSAEQTNYPREVCEQALAHKLPDKVEAAYMRSDFLEKRKQLMQDWANYITSQLTEEDFDVYLKPAPNVFEQEQKSTIKDFETIHFSLKSRNRVK